MSTNQTNWNHWLPTITFALNTSEAFSFGYYPYFLVFGHQPTFCTELTLPNPFEMSSTVKDHLARTIQAQEEAQDLDSAHLATYQAKMKAQYDQSSNNRTIESGDIAYMYVPRLRTVKTKRNLQASFYGQCIVVRLSMPTTAILRKDLTTRS